MKNAAVVIALLITCFLIGCDNDKSSSRAEDAISAAQSSPDAASSAPDPQNAPDSDGKGGEAEQSAESRALEDLLSAGPLTSDYGQTRYYIWDNSLLPAIFPAEIADIKVERTEHKGPDNQPLSRGNQVGKMYFPDSDYEEWSVSFQGNAEHVRALLADLEGKDFVGGQIDDHQHEFEYAGNGYYAFIRVDETSNNPDYQYDVTIQLTKATLQMPKTFRGTLLPQVGVARSSYDDWVIFGYDANFDEVEANYDLKTDSGILPPHYAALFEYYCVTKDDVRASARQMLENGWELRREIDGDSYSASLYKDGMYARCHFIPNWHAMEVGFSSVLEFLDY